MAMLSNVVGERAVIDYVRIPAACFYFFDDGSDVFRTEDSGTVVFAVMDLNGDFVPFIKGLIDLRLIEKVLRLADHRLGPVGGVGF
jgi:hypothetical protein